MVVVETKMKKGSSEKKASSGAGLNGGSISERVEPAALMSRATMKSGAGSSGAEANGDSKSSDGSNVGAESASFSTWGPFGLSKLHMEKSIASTDLWKEYAVKEAANRLKERAERKAAAAKEAAAAGLNSTALKATDAEWKQVSSKGRTEAEARAIVASLKARTALKKSSTNKRTESESESVESAELNGTALKKSATSIESIGGPKKRIESSELNGTELKKSATSIGLNSSTKKRFESAKMNGTGLKKSTTSIGANGGSKNQLESESELKGRAAKKSGTALLNGIGLKKRATSSGSIGSNGGLKKRVESTEMNGTALKESATSIGSNSGSKGPPESAKWNGTASLKKSSAGSNRGAGLYSAALKATNDEWKKVSSKGRSEADKQAIVASLNARTVSASSGVKKSATKDCTKSESIGCTESDELSQKNVPSAMKDRAESESNGRIVSASSVSKKKSTTKNRTKSKLKGRSARKWNKVLKDAIMLEESDSPASTSGTSVLTESSSADTEQRAASKQRLKSRLELQSAARKRCAALKKRALLKKKAVLKASDPPAPTGTEVDRLLELINGDREEAIKLVAIGKESTNPRIARQIQLIKEGYDELTVVSSTSDGDDNDCEMEWSKLEHDMTGIGRYSARGEKRPVCGRCCL